MIISLLLSISLFASAEMATSPPTNRCLLELSGLGVGKKYTIHLDGDSKIRNVKFLRNIEKGGITYLEFEEKGVKEELRIPAEDITYLKRNTLIPEGVKLIDYLIEFAKVFLLAPISWHDFVKVSFVPHRPVLNRERIRIDGQIWTSKTTARKVADIIEEFDLKMSNMGFSPPYFTKVLLVDRPILPGNGPGFATFPTFSFRRLRIAHVIRLDPAGYDVAIAVDSQVIRHERTHSILFSSYKSDAYVNSSHALREGLADFFSAHISGNPKIGPKEGGGIVRDIESMRSKSVEIKSLVDLEGVSFHDASLILSNFLWRVRGKVGAEKLDTLLKPLMNKLNSMGGQGQ